MSRETFSYDNLIAGDYPIVTDRQQIQSGQVLSRGTLLGKHTSGGSVGLLRIIDADGTTGTQHPYAILAEDIDASGGAKYGSMYLTGEFNQHQILVDSNDLATDFKDACKAIGIFMKNSQREV